MLYLPQALNDLRDDTRVVGRSKTARRWSQRAVRLSAPGGGRGHARPGLWRPEGRRCGGVAVSEIETKTEAELAIGDVLTGAESELRAQGCLLFKEVEEDDEEDE